MHRSSCATVFGRTTRLDGSFRRERAGGFLFDTRENFYYVANGVAPEAGTVDVRFRFRLLTTPPEFRDGGTARVLIAAQRPSLHHFSVTLTPDTIAFTETSRIFVQAKDADSQAVEFDTTALLRLSLTAKEEYGTFIDKNGDTLTTTPVRLENVPYGDVKSGLIRFAAVKKNPDSVVVCRMQVELQSDSSKNAEKDIIVLEKTLKIVMADPHAVRPVVPPTTVNAPRNENRKQFTVRMTRGGQLVADHPFRLTTNYVDGSGGHDHVQPRRTDNRENYGHFILLRTGVHHERPYEGQTQGNGREELDYVASVWGDTMKIYLQSTNNPLFKDSTSVLERVPNLVLLTEDTNYAKTGGTATHHGPPGWSQDNNHWITVAAQDSLTNAAQEFRNGRWNRVRERMRVNDISLVFGGGFDLGGNWTEDVTPPNCRENLRGHCEHRLGIDVDIENLSRLNELRDAFQGTGWNFVDEGQSRGSTRYPHFHFTE